MSDEDDRTKRLQDQVIAAFDKHIAKPATPADFTTPQLKLRTFSVGADANPHVSKGIIEDPDARPDDVTEDEFAGLDGHDNASAKALGRLWVEVLRRRARPTPTMRGGPGRVNVFKAQPTGDQVIPDLEIVAYASWPDYDAERYIPHDQFISRSAELHDEQAAKIEAALCASLPGGTLDRLIGRLLLSKASHFRIPWDPSRKS